MTYYAEPVLLRAVIVVTLLALLLGGVVGALLHDAFSPSRLTDPSAELFAGVVRRIEHLELDRQDTEALLEHLCGTSRVAFFQAVQTSDFIHRLLEASPGLPAHQRRELLAIADEVVALAKRVPHDAFARAMASRPHRTAGSSVSQAWMSWDTASLWRWLRDN